MRPMPPPLTEAPGAPSISRRLTDDELARCLVWAPCPNCGKERQRFCRDGERSAELVEGYRKLMAISVCRACEMEHSIERDACPESVTIYGGGRGVSACRLGWKHEGRCEPWSDDAERAAMAEQWRVDHDAV